MMSAAVAEDRNTFEGTPRDILFHSFQPPTTEGRYRAAVELLRSCQGLALATLGN
jgi:hypothetical protein